MITTARMIFRRHVPRCLLEKSPPPSTHLSLSLLLLLAALALPAASHAQLVADGATNVLVAGYTNVPGNVTVGTNGTLTSLGVSTGATVTNNGNIIISANASAVSNFVDVFGSAFGLPSSWTSSGECHVGDSGSFSQLDIFDGGTMTNSFAYIGYGSTAKSNAVLVSVPGSVWSTAALRVGNSGPGNMLVVYDGAAVLSANVIIGQNSSSSSNVAVVSDSGSTWSAGTFSVGNSGPGNQLLVTSGGALTSGAVTIGVLSPGNAAAVTGTNSVWRNSTMNVGGGSGYPNNQLLISGGGSVLSASVCNLGIYSGSNTITVTDPGSLFTNTQFYVGYPSSGNQLIISNGAVASTLTTYVVASGGSNQVIVTGAGSLLTNSSDFNLGYGASRCLLFVTNGGIFADNNGILGGENSLANSNRVLITDASSLWTNTADLHVGDTGLRNVLVVTNGAQVVAQNCYIGYNSGSSSNTILVTDAGSLLTNRNSIFCGEGGSFNQLTISNGAVVTAPSCGLGGNSGANTNSALVTGAGSVWRAAGSPVTSSPYLIIGGNSTGNQLIVSNSGALFVQGTLFIGQNPGSTGNGLTVSGGSVILTNNLGPTSANIASSCKLTVNSGLFQGNLSCSGGSVIFNGGRMQVRTTSTYTGPSPFVIGDGADAATFEMLSSGTHAFSQVVVTNNGVLVGFGQISGSVTVGSGGTISPGTNTSIGSILVTGSLSLKTSSIASMKVNAANGQSDSVTHMTTVTYGGTLQITNLSGGLGSGSSFALFSAGSYSGAFDAISPASPGPHLRWDTYELPVDGRLRVFSTNTARPVFTTASAAGASLVLSASGGIAYDPCYLVTSTNPTLPLSTWTPLSTNYFDSGGNFTWSNTISATDPQRYFSLRVN